MRQIYILTYFDNHMSGESEYLIGVFDKKDNMIKYLKNKGYEYFEESGWGTTIIVPDENYYNDLIKRNYNDSRFEYKVIELNQPQNDHMVDYEDVSIHIPEDAKAIEMRARLRDRHGKL